MKEYEFGIVEKDTVAPEPTYKSVFNPGIARHMIQSGCVLHDIKPDKHYPQRTIFIFEVNDLFNKCLDEERGGQE